MLGDRPTAAPNRARITRKPRQPDPHRPPPPLIAAATDTAIVLLFHTNTALFQYNGAKYSSLHHLAVHYTPSPIIFGPARPHPTDQAPLLDFGVPREKHPRCIVKSSSRRFGEKGLPKRAKQGYTAKTALSAAQEVTHAGAPHRRGHARLEQRFNRRVHGHPRGRCKHRPAPRSCGSGHHIWRRGPR